MSDFPKDYPKALLTVSDEELALVKVPTPEEIRLAFKRASEMYRELSNRHRQRGPF